MVEFDVSADKSSTENENEEFKLTQLPASRRLGRRQQRQQKLPAMTEDRCAATLRANKSVIICVFYISEIVILSLSSNDLSERFFF